MSALLRMRRANPVPDQSRLLAGASDMDAFILSVNEKRGLTDQIPGTPVAQGGVTEPKRPYGGWLVALAVAAVTLLLFGTTSVLFRGAPPASDTESPGGSDSIARVLSTYDALNSGDVSLWLTHFTDDAVIFGLPKLSAGNLYTVLSTADYQATLVDPCRRIEPTPQGEDRVVCTITEMDDFHAGGGITLTREESFVVAEDGMISEVSARVVTFTQPGYYVFNQAFFDWLRVAHPAVHADIKPSITTHLPAEPEHMTTALEYLDEFLAQSDLYPIVRTDEG